ncbi:hypothetical protein QVD17_15241 [Tagetes erecta]|uniref:Uncharacterized protein n=1 Tax=Tagetes erecta TaxID=13708 RepID=A0AAD8KVK7_TARER|nr:hypothetical protein QVD17_15241 [Tagetes erecta]
MSSSISTSVICTITSNSMAAQNSLWTFTHKTIPQLLKHVHHHTTLMHDHSRCIWSVSGSTLDHQLKWCSNLSKRNESLCKCMGSPQSRCMLEESDVKHAKLVEVVRELITKDISDVKFEDLFMVDALERLGLDYHYEDEINLILQQCYLQFVNKDFMEHRTLYEVSLCFRILRQNGFPVLADVFESYIRKDTKFMENVKYDIRGLMELYEASHLCIEGENILDEAAIFSSHMLQKTLSFLDDKEARMVRYTLENPHRRNFTWFNLLNSSKDTDDTILKELAQLNYTMAKSINKMEINEILRWCKDIGLEQDLNLARNQPLKWWDIKAIDQLPYYMKSSVKAVYDTTNEIASKVYEQHGFNPIKSLQQSWVTLCEAFLLEAKWFASRHIPKSDEYLKNGMVSSGVQVFLVHMFFLLGDGVCKENANLIDNNHGIVSSVSKILRLSDDLEPDQDDDIQDDHDGSYIKCLLMEHEHCSNEIVREHVKKMISDTWKHLNKECLSPNPFSKNFLKGSINLARLVPSMYSYKHKNSFDLIEQHIKSIL